MKKHNILISVLAMIAMTGCGAKESTPDTNTTNTTADTTSAIAEHTYSDKWAYDETSHWHECIKDGHTDISGKADHTFGEWKVKTAATYTTDEIVERACTVCGKKEEKTNPDSKLPKKSRELSVAEIEDDVYDGCARAITRDMITCTNDIGGLVIEYRSETETEYTTEAPIDAGTYYYRVTLNGTDEWEEKVVTGDFTICQYNLGLPKTDFVSLGTLSSGDVILYTYDVSTISNGRDTEVHLTVDSSYNTVGKHTIDFDATWLDNSNYFITSEYETETITLKVGDTSDLRVTIKQAYTINDTPALTTNSITQGTIHPGDTLYVNELGKSITVTRLSQNGKLIEAATIGEAVDMLVSGVTTDELKAGMYLITGDPIPLEQCAFADITVKEKSVTTNGCYNLYFPDYDITKKVRITLPNNAESLSSGETSTGVRIDFVGEFTNWIGREFIISEPGYSTIRATGKITSLHEHSADLSTTGKCSDCGLNNVETMTFDSSGKAVSGNKTFFKGEAYQFHTTIPCAKEATKYKFEINLASTSDQYSNYSITIVSKTGKIIQDITNTLDTGVLTVPAGNNLVKSISIITTIAKTQQDNTISTLSFSITKQ